MLNYGDMSQGIMGTVTGCARIHIWDGDDLQTKGSDDGYIDADGCMSGKTYKLMDDWCIAGAEQTIFLSPSKERSDRNGT